MFSGLCRSKCENKPKVLGCRLGRLCPAFGSFVFLSKSPSSVPSVVLRLAPPRPEAWPEQGPAGPGLAGAGLRAV